MLGASRAPEPQFLLFSSEIVDYIVLVAVLLPFFARESLFDR
jgi:hypothetical protein